MLKLGAVKSSTNLKRPSGEGRVFSLPTIFLDQARMTRLRIQETFQETIQGEGAYAGHLVDFIRLFGCPVGCWFCDTGYSENELAPPQSELMAIGELVRETRSPRVVISGGEPLVNPRLPELIEALLAANREVSIETSGAYWQEIPDSVWITLSPKEHLWDGDRAIVSEQMWERCNEIKIVISSGKEVDYYWERIKNRNKPVFLQPEWYNSAETIPKVLELIRENPKFRVSLQLHKYLGID